MGKQAVLARKKYAQRVRLVVGPNSAELRVNVDATHASEESQEPCLDAGSLRSRYLSASGDGGESGVDSIEASPARIKRVSKSQMLGKGVLLFSKHRASPGVRAVEPDLMHR